MAIKPSKKLQNPLTTPGGGTGRGSGGMRGQGAKKAVTPKTVKKAVPPKPVKKVTMAEEASAKRSVLPKTGKGVNVLLGTDRAAAARVNKFNTIMTLRRKSGVNARTAAKSRESDWGFATGKSVVKVDSAIKTAKPSAATVKATKKALKKINK